MTPADARSMMKRWQELSTVCWCRNNYLCSACRNQDAIFQRVKNAGYNPFDLPKKEAL